MSGQHDLRVASGPPGNRIRRPAGEENSVTSRFLGASLALPLAFALAGAHGLEAQTDPKIISAESAAPESIARQATVMDVDQTVLRAGTNGWTCLPDFPDTLGSDPMCLDAPWMEWFGAYMSNTPPNISGIGFGYMLGGDAAASNTDPFATAPTDSNEWMSYGSPHIMMIVPDPSMLEGIPTSPSAAGPWVMWRDTPFAHVMLPVAEPGQYIMAH
jgi:hypothetical protein